MSVQLATTTTNRQVQYHGWVLAKGAPVIVQSIQEASEALCQTEDVATVTTWFGKRLGMPVSALSKIPEGVRRERYDPETGRMVPA